jgi:hypothetical protein
VRRVVLVAVMAASLLIPAIAAAPVRAGTDNPSRAADGFAAMERFLFDPRSGKYRDQVGANPGAHAWPVSQAIAATIALAKSPGASPRVAAAAAARLARIETFRKGPVYAAWPGGDVYWDDNEWLAQDLLADGRASSVVRAWEIFGAVVRAWDNDASTPCAGGVQWTEAQGNDDRNTVSTVNGALIGLELYAVKPSPAILYWSRKMLDWVNACMLAEDGLTWDHIDRTGNVDTTHWSYNEGSLIGALVLLAQVTHDPSSLAQAEALADRALAYYNGRWPQEPPEFASIFFVNLLRLATVVGRTDYVAAAQEYADDAWVSHRDARTGLYQFGGTTRLLDQAALVQLYASLAASGR